MAKEHDRSERAAGRAAGGGLSRRDLLRNVGIGAGGLVAASSFAALVAACGGGSSSGGDAAPAEAAATTSSGSTSSGSTAGAGASGGVTKDTLSFVWVGASCEAPLYTAYEKGFFEDEGLTVELVKSDGTAVHDVIASNKAQGAPGILYQWLKPIESGVNVKLTGGLHGGCLRLIAGKDTGIAELADLKGQTIATDAIGGSAHSFFSVELEKAGVDPVKDVTWKAYPFDQLGEVINRGDVPASAAPDPFVYLALRDGYANEVWSNLHGDLKSHFCCVVALNGDLVANDVPTAQAIVRAWFRGAAYAGANPDEVAQIEVDKNYVPIDVAAVGELLKQYPFHPSVAKLGPELVRGVEEFKTTGILAPNTEPAELAAKAYVDLFDGQEPAIQAAYFKGAQDAHAHAA
jgi:NitT/TauT family transport system substrate-binding protein